MIAPVSDHTPPPVLLSLLYLMIIGSPPTRWQMLRTASRLDFQRPSLIRDASSPNSIPNVLLFDRSLLGHGPPAPAQPYSSLLKQMALVVISFFLEPAAAECSSVVFWRSDKIFDHGAHPLTRDCSPTVFEVPTLFLRVATSNVSVLGACDFLPGPQVHFLPSLIFSSPFLDHTSAFLPGVHGLLVKFWCVCVSRSGAYRALSVWPEPLTSSLNNGTDKHLTQRVEFTPPGDSASFRVPDVCDTHGTFVA